ncbi:hypothetical protein ABID96_000602 [Bacillus sp. OAE603]
MLVITQKMFLYRETGDVLIVLSSLKIYTCIIKNSKES